MKTIDRVIHLLCKLKKENPEQIICIESKDAFAWVKLGDALIYEDTNGSIVIDAE